MDENEIMVTEEAMNEEPEVMEEKSGMSTGLAMVLGGLITAGAIAGGKKLKSLWDKHKAKKEIALTQDSDEVTITDSEESSDPEKDK